MADIDAINDDSLRLHVLDGGVGELIGGNAVPQGLSQRGEQGQRGGIVDRALVVFDELGVQKDVSKFS